ncbi:hypothetical protein Z043_117860, partial [Scleropages formosus]
MLSSRVPHLRPRAVTPNAGQCSCDVVSCRTPNCAHHAPKRVSAAPQDAGGSLAPGGHHWVGLSVQELQCQDALEKHPEKPNGSASVPRAHGDLPVSCRGSPSELLGSTTPPASPRVEVHPDTKGMMGMLALTPIHHELKQPQEE